MDTEKIYHQKKALLEGKLNFLEDKPEETIDSTLRSLWFTASGQPKSAEEAMKLPLPGLDPEQIKILDDLIQHRLDNTPLAHITKRQNFMGIEMKADKRALIPRKETEILAKKALEISLTFPKVNVIDVCCGAGNVGISIAYHNPAAKVFEADLSGEAVELTKENIIFLNLQDRVNAMQSDLFEAFMNEDFYEKMDMVTCNPPYISSFKVTKMDAEIAGNEPSLAFDGGMLGIKIIQRLIREAPRFMVQGGWLLFEVGLGQGTMIMDLCTKTGLYNQVEPALDVNGNIRVVIAQKK